MHLVNLFSRSFKNLLPDDSLVHKHSLIRPINATHHWHTPVAATAHMSVFRGQVIASCGETRKTTSHTPPCTCLQEVATYLTDFIDLSNLLAGLLPGDSFLLRRKASRFFMSLALSKRKIDGREKERVGEREERERKIYEYGMR